MASVQKLPSIPVLPDPTQTPKALKPAKPVKAVEPVLSGRKVALAATSVVIGSVGAALAWALSCGHSNKPLPIKDLELRFNPLTQSPLLRSPLFETCTPFAPLADRLYSESQVSADMQSLLTRAACEGSGSAQLDLYFFHKEQSPALALEWLKKAASQQTEKTKLARDLLSAQLKASLGASSVRDWFEHQAAIGSKHARKALYELVILKSPFLSQEQVHRYTEWAAEEGDVLALHQAARGSIEGNGYPKNIPLGVARLEKLSSQGDRAAASRLFSIYRGTYDRFSEELKPLQSAEKAYALASAFSAHDPYFLASLGLLYIEGTGLPQPQAEEPLRVKQGLDLLKQAANQGSAFALQFLSQWDPDPIARAEYKQKSDALSPTYLKIQETKS